MPARRGRRGRRAPPPGLGRPELVPRRPAALARAPRRARPRAGRGAGGGRRRRGVPGALRPAGGAADRARPPDRVQPARLAPRHARRRPQALSPVVSGGADAPARRPGGIPGRRPRRGGHGGARGLLPPVVRAPGRPGGRRPRRGRGGALPAGLAAARAVPGALRREADPAPRPRHDPRGGRARPGDPLQGRGRRPARAAARRPSGERRACGLDPVPGAPRRLPARGVRARDLRHGRRRRRA